MLHEVPRARIDRPVECEERIEHRKLENMGIYLSSSPEHVNIDKFVRWLPLAIVVVLLAFRTVPPLQV